MANSVLSKINFVDVAVVLVFVAVMMCLMKKMDVVEGLCGVNEGNLTAMGNIPWQYWSGDRAVADRAFTQSRNELQELDGGEVPTSWTAEEFNTWVHLQDSRINDDMGLYVREECGNFNSQPECEVPYWNTLYRQHLADSPSSRVTERLFDEEICSLTRQGRTRCPSISQCTWTEDTTEGETVLIDLPDTSTCTVVGLAEATSASCPVAPQGKLVPDSCPLACASAITQWVTACPSGTIPSSLPFTSADNSAVLPLDGQLDAFAAKCEDAFCTQENIESFGGSGEVCVGTWERYDGSTVSCTGYDRDDCEGTRGCRVKQCPGRH